MKCPYCQAECAQASVMCSSCQTAFPWAAEVQRLEGMIKEREINRLRATITLVQEAYGAARGGPAVTFSAIKGFVAAWMFPSAVIALGSLVGAVFVVLQTWILVNQTKMLAVQTQAAQIERADVLRIRLLENARVREDLDRIISSLKHDDALPECEFKVCREPISNALQRLNGDQIEPKLSDDELVKVKVHWAGLLDHLDDMKKSLSPKPEQSLISKVSDVCMLKPALAANLDEEYRVVSVITGFPKTLTVSLMEKILYFEGEEKFDGEGKIDVAQFQNWRTEIARSRLEPLTWMEVEEESLSSLMSQLINFQKKILPDFVAAKEQCKSRRQLDEELLQKMEAAVQ